MYIKCELCNSLPDWQIFTRAFIPEYRLSLYIVFEMQGQLFAHVLYFVVSEDSFLSLYLRSVLFITKHAPRPLVLYSGSYYRPVFWTYIRKYMRPGIWTWMRHSAVRDQVFGPGYDILLSGTRYLDLNTTFCCPGPGIWT